eukprot:maker-scaffold798_size95657-snap-gene-0.26 protein:Tk09163 transcript:maker-scaffold798_size95657-snap-gene-0.26-mRNA-1 annotation:"unknown secreted protein"
MVWLLVLQLVVSIQLIQAKDVSPWKKLALSKDKEKLSKWTADQKKPVFAKPSTADKLKKEHDLEESEMSLENETSDRMCLALKEESLPDFFLKFGLQTNLITDVTGFNNQMKSKNWTLKKKYRGLPDQDRQLMGKQKTRIRTKPLKHNRLPQKARQRSDTAYIPPCYGFNYLASVEAIDTDSGTPDVDTLTDVLADMPSMTLAKKISNIFDQCRDYKGGCPSELVHSAGVDCYDACVSGRDCSSEEMCCPTQCGGTKCYNPTLARKYRSAEVKSKKKCQSADSFMECVYKKLQSDICA